MHHDSLRPVLLQIQDQTACNQRLVLESDILNFDLAQDCFRRCIKKRQDIYYLYRKLEEKFSFCLFCPLKRLESRRICDENSFALGSLS